MSLNEKYRKNSAFCDTFSFWLENSAFALDESKQQNQGKNQQEKETHTVDGFTMLGFWEDFGAVGEKSCDEINHCYNSSNAKIQQEYSPPIEWLFHKDIRNDLSRKTGNNEKGHPYEKLRNGALLVAENVSVFQFAHVSLFVTMKSIAKLGIFLLNGETKPKFVERFLRFVGKTDKIIQKHVGKTDKI